MLSEKNLVEENSSNHTQIKSNITFKKSLLKRTIFFSVFLNLSSILLRFTRPICQGVGNLKVIKIDPTYTSIDCKVSEDSFLRNIHLRNVTNETFLLPSTDEDKEKENVPDSFNFVSTLKKRPNCI